MRQSNAPNSFGHVKLVKGQAAMRTRLSICNRKVRYKTEAEAMEAVQRATITLRHYRCDRCRQFHLTSRTKGKRVPRPVTKDTSQS